MDGEMTCVRHETGRRNVTVNGRSRADTTAKAQARMAGDRQVERAVLEATERERSRLGRDLHDGVLGTLAGIGMMLDAMKRHLTATPVDRKAMEEEIDGLSHIVRETIGQTRGIVTGLCPVDLKADGLTKALGLLASTTGSLFRIDCRLRCERPVHIEDEVVAAQLYYIAHEAVNNACKHAKARSILITVESIRGCLTLTVEDDGVGLPEGQVPGGGMGLRTMRHRAELIGAALGIRRGALHGTAIECVIPV